MKAFIFAAGLGTRLGALTNEKPKALVKVNGIPMLQLLILRLKKQGITDFVINVHHFADQIIAFLEQQNNFNCTIQISDERELLLDTGGGLKKAEPFFKNEANFLIHNVDILTTIDFEDMAEEHYKSQAVATLAVQKRDSTRKLLFNKEKSLCGWRNIPEKKEIISRHANTYSPMAFSGVHFVSSEIFKLLPPLSKYSIIPEYLKIAKTKDISAYICNEKVIDMGTPERIATAEKLLSAD